MNTDTQRFAALTIDGLRFDDRGAEPWVQVTGTTADGTTDGAVAEWLPVTDPALVTVLAGHLLTGQPVDLTVVWETVAGHRCLLRGLTLRPVRRRPPEQPSATAG